jgi:hypothetical protein
LEYDERSPEHVLLRFVERLPTTIRDVVLARCCIAFDRLQASSPQDLFATFRAILLASDRAPLAYTCAKMISVVELALAVPDAPFQRDWHAAIQTQRIDAVDWDGPLTRRHWRAAREEFMRLRATVLDVRALSDMLPEAAEGEHAANGEPHTSTT